MSGLGRCWAAVSDVFTPVPGDPERRLAPAGAAEDAAFVNRLSTQIIEHPARLLAACLATLLAPALIAQAGSLGTRPPGEAPRQEGPSATPVQAPIPGDSASWLPVAREAAATCPGLSSAVLIALGHIESGLGVQVGPSTAGAVGPMQFLPTTWAEYGADGDGDGLVDVMNPVDAVHGAARLLCANGAADPDRLASALWNYNHSDDYVRQVISLSRLIPVES